MTTNELLHKLVQEIEELKIAAANDRKRNNESVSILKKNLDQQIKANAEVHNAVYLLQEEKTNLRKAVHNMKLRNNMLTRKVKKLRDIVVKDHGDDDSSSEEFELIDYDDIGRSFFVIGGRNDPLATNYNVKFKDENNLEHFSAERYYWFLMAAHFRDGIAMEAIRTAETYQQAVDAQKSIVGFDEKEWKTVKIDFYTKAVQRKFDQSRFLRNILVLTGNIYLAVASDDKLFGTGWRKQRDESGQPLKWDGDNKGGKILMNLRKKYTNNHQWQDEEEKNDTEQRFREIRRYNWHRPTTGEKINSNRNGQKRTGSGKGVNH